MHCPLYLSRVLHTQKNIFMKSKRQSNPHEPTELTSCVT